MQGLRRHQGHHHRQASRREEDRGEETGGQEAGREEEACRGEETHRREEQGCGEGEACRGAAVDDGEPAVRQHLRHLLPVAVQRPGALGRLPPPAPAASVATVRRDGSGACPAGPQPPATALRRRSSEMGAVRRPSVLRRVRVVPWRRRRHELLGAGAAAAAADVLPRAVAVQRVQRVQDRA